MRRIAAAFVALTTAFLVGLPGVAYADSTSPSPDSPDDQVTGTLTRGTTPGPTVSTVPSVPAIGSVKKCLDAGGVWLVVSTDVGATLANQCLATPPSSAATALTAAGLVVQRDSSGVICQIGNFPSQCASDTQNRSWQHFTATTTSAWTYAQLSPDEAKPVAGTLEGWCFGMQCTPPSVLSLMNGVNILAGITAATTVSTGTSAPAARNTGFGVVGVVIVAAVIVIAVMWLRRRGDSDQGRGRAEA